MTVIDHRLLDQGDHGEEPSGVFRRAIAHDGLDAGPVVPAAVEDHDLPRRREMRHVALDVHLRLDPRIRCGQGDVLEDPRTRSFGDPPDRASFARAVHALEHDADPGAGGLDPLLHRHELALEDPHLPLVLLPLHLAGRTRLVTGNSRLAVVILAVVILSVMFLVALAHPRTSEPIVPMRPASRLPVERRRGHTEPYG
jgi:hypothetical protein